MAGHTDDIYLGFAILFSQTKGGGRDTQHGCLIPFAKIREKVCQRLGAGNALSGGGKLSEKQRLYVGSVTDSCLACSTPDTGESSAWTCYSTANSGQNDNDVKIRSSSWHLYFYLIVWGWNTLFTILHVEKVCGNTSVHDALCVYVCVDSLWTIDRLPCLFCGAVL